MSRLILMIAAATLAAISVATAQTVADGDSASIQPPAPSQSAPESADNGATLPTNPPIPAQQLKKAAKPDNTAPPAPGQDGVLERIAPAAGTNPQIIIPPL